MLQKHVDQIIDSQNFWGTSLYSDFISAGNYFTLREGLCNLTNVFIGCSKKLSQGNML